MTMKDVGGVAGVSTATVSYVLSGKKHISSGVVRRVHEAVEKTNYKLNTAARALRVGASRIIGLMIPDLTNPLFPKLTQEIKHQAYALGYAVILMDTSYKASTEVEDLLFLQDKGVDGIIWVPSGTDLPKLSISVPIVVIDHATEGYSTVHADDFGGGRLQARFALDHGHHTVMQLSGPQILKSAYERRRGFYAQIQDKGLEVALDIETPVSFDIPRRVIEKVMDNVRSCTYIACGNDIIAIGVMKRLLDAGIKVPDQISIIGFDNNMMAEFVRPSLSTIAQSTEKIGSLAVSMMINLVKNPSNNREDMVVPVRVIERDSVKDLSCYAGGAAN